MVRWEVHDLVVFSSNADRKEGQQRLPEDDFDDEEAVKEEGDQSSAMKVVVIPSLNLMLIPVPLLGRMACDTTFTGHIETDAVRDILWCVCIG